MAKVKLYFLNVLVWIDQGINTVLFGGAPDETISSRVGRNQHIWICRVAKRVIDSVFGKGHCEAAIEPEECRVDEL